MRSRAIALLIVVAVGALWFASGGCTSGALPPRLSDEELTIVRSVRFRAAIAVERDQYPVYSERLIRSLQRTGLFDAVGSPEEVPDATLVARVQRRIYGTATVPMLTGLSLGIIPTTVQEEWGESFTLRRRGTSTPEVAVEFSYVGPTTLGWVAAIRALSPDISTKDPRSTERFRDALALRLCAKAAEIERLMSLDPEDATPPGAGPSPQG